MLRAHSVVLQNLLERYETLRALHAEKSTKEARQRVEDVAYTLCVSTGTRRIGAAERLAPCEAWSRARPAPALRGLASCLGPGGGLPWGRAWDLRGSPPGGGGWENFRA